jgi:hypothetical protein
MICFTPAAKTQGDDVGLFRRFRFAGSGSLAMIKAPIIPQRIQKGDGDIASFPPEGVEVVSWQVMMGVGQVVTLRLPASRLREVNRIRENTA